MPIMLVGDASWRGEIALANNDLAFEVITPSHMLEVKTYPNKWAEEQAAREFSNRTQTEWDACIANARSRRASQSSRNAIAAAMANLPPFATVNQMPADSGIARGSHTSDGLVLELQEGIAGLRTLVTRLRRFCSVSMPAHRLQGSFSVRTYVPPLIAHAIGCPVRQDHKDVPQTPSIRPYAREANLRRASSTSVLLPHL